MSTSITEVQVLAEGGAAANTQTQELSQFVDTRQLAQLPSLTRNPYDFVVLSGNVSNGDSTTNNVNSDQNLSRRGVGYSINGQRQTRTEILLDGVENISVFSFAVGEQVPIDSVQEYNIVTNNFAAEYRRASGGIVNLTTKQGQIGSTVPDGNSIAFLHIRLTPTRTLYPRFPREPIPGINSDSMLAAQ